MGEALRLGVVGCGGIARFTALFARWNRGIHLAACCDVSKEKAKAFAQRYGFEWSHTSLDEMLNETEMDAVYLAVPHHLHHPMLTAALGKSYHVLVEKPVTRTLDEGRDIVKRADEKGLKVGVNYQYRYSKACHALAAALRDGALGKVHYARIHVPWSRKQSYFDTAPWHRFQAQAGGGTLITQGSHFLDLLLWGMDSPPESAAGYVAKMRFEDVEVEDLAQGIVQLKNGSFLQITSTMAAHAERPVTIEVYGEKGSAFYTNRPFPRLRFRGVRLKKRPPPCSGIHALQRSLEGFRSWVKEGKPYLTPAKDALPVLASVEAIYRSAQTGKREAVCIG